MMMMLVRSVKVAIAARVRRRCIEYLTCAVRIKGGRMKRCP